MKKVYDHKEVSTLLGISESQIRYWDKVGLISHVEKRQGLLFFDFKGLVSFRAVKELLKKGVSLRKIRKTLERLREVCPEVESLREVAISVHGRSIIVTKDNMRFTPEGQILMDFSTESVPSVPLRHDSSESLFFNAMELESEGEYAGAANRYLEVLARDPGHPDALVNLGNIEYSTGSPERAEYLYRQALMGDPDHVEANYNLANILFGQGDIINAVLFYKKALHEDPDLACAHLNIARALDELGEKEDAREHLRHYLRLDPAGEWAEYARLFLES